MSYLRRKESGLCLRKDRRRSGFAWIDCSDRDQSVVSYRRRHGEDELVVVVNATPEPRVDYRIFETLASVIAEPIACHGYPQSLCLRLPPLSCLVLAPAG
jgi:1,4-alpha-glucan branching enzyme